MNNYRAIIDQLYQFQFVHKDIVHSFIVTMFFTKCLRHVLLEVGVNKLLLICWIVNKLIVDDGQKTDSVLKQIKYF